MNGSLNNIFFILIGLLLFVTCNYNNRQQSNLTSHQCEGKIDPDDGIFVEYPDSLAPSRHLSYSNDNLIYKPGRKWIYKYHWTNNGKSFRFVLPESEDSTPQDWSIVDSTTNEYYTKAIASYRMSIPTKTGFYEDDSLYQQTIVAFRSFQANGTPSDFSSYTGVIENCQNIWLHPLRFGLLEFNQVTPYPYIQFPLEKGLSYSWNFEIGQGWGNPLWAEWEGLLKINYQYRIGKEITYELKNKSKEIPCTEILAEGQSRIGSSTARFVFSRDYGFLEMEYTLNDSLKMSITLDSLSDGNLEDGVW